MMADDLTYRVEIKHRGKPPKPYRWEIYRDGKPLAVKKALLLYASRRAAIVAGERALARFRKQTRHG
jgi:hypothetical protein